MNKTGQYRAENLLQLCANIVRPHLSCSRSKTSCCEHHEAAEKAATETLNISNDPVKQQEKQTLLVTTKLVGDFNKQFAQVLNSFDWNVDRKTIGRTADSLSQTQEGTMVVCSKISKVDALAGSETAQCLWIV